MPPELHDLDNDNIDKLAVVYGAHRYRYGDPIRFHMVPCDPIVSTRFIGTTQATPRGFSFNRLFVKVGDSYPITKSIVIGGNQEIKFGRGMLEKGIVETIAILVNRSDKNQTVKIDFVNDNQIRINQEDNNNDLFLTEWFPGGLDEIIDNYNDTGRIDQQPNGFIKSIISPSLSRWMYNE